MPFSTGCGKMKVVGVKISDEKESPNGVSSGEDGIVIVK